jgi:hypothetical protein
MKAVVKIDFIHSKENKTYKKEDVFSGDKSEIDRINSIIPNALELVPVKEFKKRR